MDVGEICTREVDIAHEDETVETVANRMLQRWVGSLVVLNPVNEPIGLITDRDIVTRVVATRRSPATTTLDEVMTTPVQTVFENEPVIGALSTMRTGGFRRLPVVNRDRKVTGLVTLDDILLHVIREGTLVGGLLERQAIKDPVLH